MLKVKKKSRFVMESSASSNVEGSNRCLSRAAVAFVIQAEKTTISTQPGSATFLRDFHHRLPRMDVPSSDPFVYPLPPSQSLYAASLSVLPPSVSSFSHHPKPSSSLPSVFRASPNIAIAVSPWLSASL